MRSHPHPKTPRILSDVSANALKKLRQTYHTLRNTATLTPFTAKDCEGRTYHRLNQDYQPLHALCRFFLDYLTPSHTQGDHSTLPFLVDMARLYERFLANWLKVHLPPHLCLQAQERVQSSDRTFNLDLVICDRTTQKTQFVLDTKYKTPKQASNADIYQIAFYTQLKHCSKGILIYPQPLQNPLNLTENDCHIQSATFALNQDLETTGQQFLQDLLEIAE